jgi:nucleoside-diphosphate-sugar epimerase
MRILVVGGTGLIGGHAALYLKEQGHNVTLMARSAPKPPALQALPFIEGNYALDDFSDGRLEGFDALVFAAGGDIRHIPTDGSMTPEDFYTQYNSEGIPAFFKAARDAGIPRAVYIGSYYPQVAPEQVERNPYVRSRKIADDTIRAMSGPDFSVISLNAPFVLGQLDGLDVPHLRALISYARGEIEGAPLFALPGATNHISVESLSQAVAGALTNGRPGKAYLVGDENLTWKAYLEYWCRHAGNPQNLEVRDAEHPMLPDMILFAGRGTDTTFEPEGVRELGYARDRIDDTVAAIVAANDSSKG